MNAHPGFKAVQSKIEGEGYSPRAAGAILAKKTRNASPAAKKKNPRLNRVGGANPVKKGPPTVNRATMGPATSAIRNRMLSGPGVTTKPSGQAYYNDDY